VYDQWVKNSFARLAKLVPAKFDRPEKLEEIVEIPLAISSHQSSTEETEDQI
jgi:hypothetical protein